MLDDICTSLEPTLGVMNACLPVLQLVMSEFSGSKMLVWSKLRSSGGTPRKRLGSMDVKDEIWTGLDVQLLCYVLSSYESWTKLTVLTAQSYQS